MIIQETSRDVDNMLKAGYIVNNICTQSRYTVIVMINISQFSH
jgi:hypothetical protein